MNNTFFITGTDTGIGKTFVTCILMQFIKFRHKRVIRYETNCCRR